MYCLFFSCLQPEAEKQKMKQNNRNWKLRLWAITHRQMILLTDNIRQVFSKLKSCMVVWRCVYYSNLEAGRETDTYFSLLLVSIYTFEDMNKAKSCLFVCFFLADIWCRWRGVHKDLRSWVRQCKPSPGQSSCESLLLTQQFIRQVSCENLTS